MKYNMYSVQPRKIKFSFSDFDRLSAEEWDKLFVDSRNRNIFYRHSWLSASAALPSVWRCQKVITGYRTDRLVFAQPVNVIDTKIGRILLFLRTPLADHVEPLIASSESKLSPLIFHYQKGGESALHHCPESSSNLDEGVVERHRPGFSILDDFWVYIRGQIQPDLIIGLSLSYRFSLFLKEKTADQQLLQDEENTQVFLIPLPGSKEQLMEQFKKKFRKNLRRKLRKAKEAKIEFRAVTSDNLPENYSLPEAFATLSRLHKMRFDYLGKRSYFLEPVIQSFHKKLLSDPSIEKPPLLFLEALHEGEVIGSDYGLLSPQQFVAFQHGFHTDYLHVGLGDCMLYHTLLFLIEHQVPVYDFKGGEEDYKKRWTKKFVKDYNMYIGFSSKAILLKELFRIKHDVQQYGATVGAIHWMKNKVKEGLADNKLLQWIKRRVKVEPLAD